ncbi:hypothetical protein GUJ93_ZPchr0011g28288 [Zizania palustris]|uniref:Cell wall hydroxyproline-rich glycoprotein n=1 Tax=Zizania palustris TaxID=103762 RepID=A0A8J5WFG8_ZIZPA|nr:hypothetical protein GUJ93_ZPchr0011g28288 [Zizania palustris]
MVVMDRDQRRRLGVALLLLVAVCSLSVFSSVGAVSSVEESYIVHRQLMAMKEAGGGAAGDLPADFEFDDRVGVGTFPNPRLRHAYIALQAWRRAFYSDPKGYTANWVGNDVCSYNGVVCVEALDDPKIMVVAGIDLNGADIAGYLPPELGLLTDLAFFHINTNRFCGIIPKSMSRLSLLHEFDVSNNRFVGFFPFVVLEMATLKYLDIRYNNFEGDLPPALFDKDFDAIFVNSNRFVGYIPENLGNSTASVIVFANNAFVGCIPKSIGRMVNTLDEISFLNNKLDGCVPMEIGYLHNTYAIDVSGNAFVGTLPVTLSNITKLEQLDVSRNVFTGIVHEAICELPALVNFSFAFNFFNSESAPCMPSENANVTLDDRSNCLGSLRPAQKTTLQCAPVLARPVDCSKHVCAGYPTPSKPSEPEKPPLITVPVAPPVISSPPGAKVSSRACAIAATGSGELSTFPDKIFTATGSRELYTDPSEISVTATTGSDKLTTNSSKTFVITIVTTTCSSELTTTTNSSKTFVTTTCSSELTTTGSCEFTTSTSSGELATARSGYHTTISSKIFITTTDFG